ncbi:hypothetical protein VNI00_014075 [Paramarasmius palmivorus]|uniref:GmrSD restriction endonucleases N-terminal domain-containing protein n=1 Tax=Paramarasmius palmivorus TaxID=297713 RepID=A0AAW0BWS3_9AGAR
MNYDDGEYDYSDEEDVLQHPESSSKGSQGDYQISEALRPPRGTQYSTHHLYTQLSGPEIDLTAVYQREVVWDDDKQIAMIDSLFRNYYVPPVIFSVKSYDDGTETRMCIDGKQRLTSVRRFMDGEIPHRDARTKERVWYTDNPRFGPKTNKKILSEGVKNTFAKKQITCVEYEGLSFDQERDVFQRVQLGMPLTPAEKLNVVHTPRSGLVRDLIGSTFGSENGIGREVEEKEIPFNPKRGKSFHTGAKTFPGITTLETWLKESKNGGTVGRRRKGKEKGRPGDDEGVEVSSELRERMMTVSKTLVKLAKEPKYTASFRETLFAKKISPIEMTGIVMLVYLLPASVSPDRLSKFILLLRAEIQRTHPRAVRLNAPCWKTLCPFIVQMVKDPEAMWKSRIDNGLTAWAGIQIAGTKHPKEEDDQHSMEGSPAKKIRSDTDSESSTSLILTTSTSTSALPPPPPPASPHAPLPVWPPGTSPASTPSSFVASLASLTRRVSFRVDPQPAMPPSNPDTPIRPQVHARPGLNERSCGSKSDDGGGGIR